MKATLEYSLPEEREEFQIVNKAADYFCALCELDRHLRSCVKYGHQYKSVEDLCEVLRMEYIPDLDG